VIDRSLNKIVNYHRVHVHMPIAPIPNSPT